MIEEKLKWGKIWIEREKRLLLRKQDLWNGMEWTNIKTGEVMIFASGSETSKYIQSLNPDYKASPGTISDAAKLGRVYKNLFKVPFL